MESNTTGIKRKGRRLRAVIAWSIAGFCLLLLFAAVSIPGLYRSREAADRATAEGRKRRLEAALFSGVNGPSVVHAAERMVVRRASLDLIVGDLGGTLRSVERLATEMGGWVERSELARGSASAQVRIPAARFDEARAALRKLTDEVGNESVTADDHTAEYVDMEANLRNFRAEEASYLAIMQRSGAIKDTLSVAERLADVRGRIERLQAQMNSLSRQVEMATIAVTLRLSAAPSELVRWRPLETIRGAWEDMSWGMAHYADAMIAVLFALPVILVWGATVVFVAAIGFRVGRWTWRRFFAPAPATAA